MPRAPRGTVREAKWAKKPRVNGTIFLQQDPGSNDLNPSIPDVNPFIQQPASTVSGYFDKYKKVYN